MRGVPVYFEPFQAELTMAQHAAELARPIGSLAYSSRGYIAKSTRMRLIRPQSHAIDAARLESRPSKEVLIASLFLIHCPRLLVLDS